MTITKAIGRAATKSELLAGISLVAMLLVVDPAAGLADDALPQAGASGTPAAASGVPARKPARLEEIVVTAQRRRQNAQKAPLAISVISSATLANAGVTSAVNLSRLVPSSQFAAAAGPFPLLYIRGVGSNTGTSFTDTAVSLNYNGVPLARSYEGLGQYYDLDRIEVLIGPQGTLYGRNATAGAINIIPAQPKLGVTSGDVGLDYGNYNSLLLSGDANLPLAPNAAVRVAFQSNRNDGYFSENAGNSENEAGRVLLRYDPTPDISTVTDIDAAHNSGTATTGVSITGNTIANIALAPGHVLSIVQPTVGFPAELGVSATDPRMIPVFNSQGLRAPAPGNDNANNSFYGIQSQINWTTDLGTLTLVPAFRHARLDFLSYGSGFGLGQREHDDQESIEARFASKENTAFRWIVGGFFLHDLASADQNIDNLEPAFLGISQHLNFTAETTSYAGFADGTYNLTPTIRLIGGGRYTLDEKTPTGGGVATNGGVVSLNGQPTHSWDAFTYRAGVQWDVALKSMLYATYSTGWHSGGFFLTHDNPIYQPEKLNAITLGSKNRFLDDRLQANLELFYWKYNNQQTSFVTLDSVGTSQFITENVGKSTRTGADLDLRYQLFENTTLGAQFEYLDSEIQAFDYKVPAFLAPHTGCAVRDTGAPQLDVSCAHNRVPFAPRWTGNLSAQQDVPLGDRGTLTGILRSHSQSVSDTGTQDVPVELQNSYTAIDASLGYTAPDRSWSFTLFGENITDRVIKTQTFQSPASGILGTHETIYFATLRAPALYGFRLRIKL